MNTPQTQSGNVFFIILMAVGLLAAITIMLSRSGSNVEQTGDVEQNRIKMSQIMRYAKSIEAAVQNLTLNGCSENEISFENNVDTNYTNARSPANKSCHIFEPEGAGLEWREFGDLDLTGTSSNINVNSDIIIEGIEDDARSELVFNVRISQALCNQINKEMGISTVAADISTGQDLWEEYYVGTFGSSNQWGPSFPGASAVEGKYAGCVIGDTGDYVYYHVLLAR